MSDDELIKACQEQIDYFGALDPTTSVILLRRFIEATTPKERVFQVNDRE